MATTRALPFSPSQNLLLLPPKQYSNSNYASARCPWLVRVNCSLKEENEEPKKTEEQSLFTSLTDALDFAQVRSAKDKELLDDAREATRAGEKMTREQYGALRRKIGGTYKDFFKSYVEVDGEYVEEGWVDKTCKVCKKDTKGEARQVDKMGRYVHVACLDKMSESSNFFTKLRLFFG